MVRNHFNLWTACLGWGTLMQASWVLSAVPSSIYHLLRKVSSIPEWMLGWKSPELHQGSMAALYPCSPPLCRGRGFISKLLFREVGPLTSLSTTFSGMDFTQEITASVVCSRETYDVTRILADWTQKTKIYILMTLLKCSPELQLQHLAEQWIYLQIYVSNFDMTRSWLNISEVTLTQKYSLGLDLWSENRRLTL